MEVVEGAVAVAVAGGSTLTVVLPTILAAVEGTYRGGSGVGNDFGDQRQHYGGDNRGGGRGDFQGLPFEPKHCTRHLKFLVGEQMKEHALHLLVLSHVFSVPSLKTVCVDQLQRGFLAPDNVVDMLQLARLCDAPCLALTCVRMVIGDFKTISLTDGWKVMRRANPSMEQELL
ncbi:hypothetical protein ACJX0J_037211, partial [Zea mays]